MVKLLGHHLAFSKKKPNLVGEKTAASVTFQLPK